jgi:hypothetical protein
MPYLSGNMPEVHYMVLRDSAQRYLAYHILTNDRRYININRALCPIYAANMGDLWHLRKSAPIGTALALSIGTETKGR